MVYLYPMYFSFSHTKQKFASQTQSKNLLDFCKIIVPILLEYLSATVKLKKYTCIFTVWPSIYSMKNCDKSVGLLYLNFRLSALNS